MCTISQSNEKLVEEAITDTGIAAPQQGLSAGHDTMMTSSKNVTTRGSNPDPVKYGAKKLYGTGGYPEGTKWTERPHDTMAPPVQTWAEYAMLLRVHVIGGKEKIHSIVIQNPDLKASLWTLFEYYPDIFQGESAWEIKPPFKAFVHRWKEFVEHCDSCFENDLNVSEAWQFQTLRSTLGPEVRDKLSTVENIGLDARFYFHQLWMLFQPGKVVVNTSVSKKFLCAYRILNTEVLHLQKTNRKFILLHCCCIDDDGKHPSLALHTEAILEYDGRHGRQELGYFPLDAYPQGSAVRERLAENGRLFQLYCGRTNHRDYNGFAIDSGGRRPVKQWVS
jgi:hypothetical protein